jgi:hypothetical protein
MVCFKENFDENRFAQRTSRNLSYLAGVLSNLREREQKFNMEKKKTVIVTVASQGTGAAIVEASCVGPRKPTGD